MAEGEVWVPCTRVDILTAERAFYAHELWQGKRMIGFNRWVEMDNCLHAVVVLTDKTRVFLDEEEARRTRPQSGIGPNFPLRWY